MCAGSYMFSAWARRSSDWAGRDLIFHHRWFPAPGTGGRTQSWGTEPGTGVEIGAFPRGTAWQRIEVSTRLNRDARQLALYLAYPWRSAGGHVDITGIDVRRIGGPGNC